MRKAAEIEKEVQPYADRISEGQRGAPVVVIVAGSTEADVPRCITVTSSNLKNDRMRDLLGILEAAKQIKSLNHLMRGRDQIVRQLGAGISDLEGTIEELKDHVDNLERRLGELESAA